MRTDRHTWLPYYELLSLRPAKISHETRVQATPSMFLLWPPTLDNDVTWLQDLASLNWIKKAVHRTRLSPVKWTIAVTSDYIRAVTGLFSPPYVLLQCCIMHAREPVVIVTIIQPEVRIAEWGWIGKFPPACHELVTLSAPCPTNHESVVSPTFVIQINYKLNFKISLRKFYKNY
jgi:hypothetical protein